jgi:hypothetical protein
VIYDDITTQRLRTCTLCGGPIATFTLESWTNGRVVAAVMLCPPCQRRDPTRAAVRGLLEERYHQHATADSAVHEGARVAPA